MSAATVAKRNDVIQPNAEGLLLSERDLDMIVAYKYKPGTYTHLDNLLTPYWTWAVTLLPTWMAPNLVTFLGLVGAAVASLLVTSYAPSFEGHVPRWCLAVFAVALFFYQTMDAIDGKQARRTNSSSPLGQLFDHGCDAVVKVLCNLALLANLGTGASSSTMVLFIVVEGVFYMAQWEEYHTGTLNWSNGYVGVTESQFLQMALFLVSACFGQGIWEVNVPGTKGVKVNQFMILALIPFAIFMVFSNIRKVYTTNRDEMPIEERGHKAVGRLPGVLQLLAMSVAMSLGVALSVGPAAPVFAKYTALQTLMLGTVTTHLTSLMIVHHMAKSPLWLHDLRCPSLVALACMTLNVYLPKLGLGDSSPLDPETALFLTTAVTLASYLRYVVGVVSDISKRLDIECFRIKHSRKE